jgi:hypothetical protein
LQPSAALFWNKYAAVVCILFPLSYYKGDDVPEDKDKVSKIVDEVAKDGKPITKDMYFLCIQKYFDAPDDWKTQATTAAPAVAPAAVAPAAVAPVELPAAAP